MKKSFKLFIDSLDVLDELTDEQAGQLFKAIREYEVNENEVLNGLMKAIFTPFKNNSDRAKVAYAEVCERNKANGIKGGRPKPTKTHSVNDEPKQSETNPKNPDKDNKKDKDKDNKKIFTFSLSASRLLSSTSKEYQSNLKDYIQSTNKQMTYEDFYNQCEMKPYKYKNFKMAYDSWNKNAMKNPIQSFKQQDQQIAKEKSDNINRLLNAGFNPFNQNDWDKLSEYETKLMQDHQQGVIDVQPTN